MSVDDVDDISNLADYSLDRLVDKSVDVLKPRTSYERKRLADCFSLVKETNKLPYPKSVFGDLYPVLSPVINDETTRLLERFYLFLSSVKQLKNYDFYLSSIELMTSSLNHLNCFSSNLHGLLEKGFFEDVTVLADPDCSSNLIKSYSERIQFINWFENYFEQNLMPDLVFNQKVIDRVWKYLSKRSDEQPLADMQRLVRRSRSFSRKNASRRLDKQVHF